MSRMLPRTWGTTSNSRAAGCRVVGCGLRTARAPCSPASLRVPRTYAVARACAVSQLSERKIVQTIAASGQNARFPRLSERFFVQTIPRRSRAQLEALASMQGRTATQRLRLAARRYTLEPIFNQPLAARIWIRVSTIESARTRRRQTKSAPSGRSKAVSTLTEQPKTLSPISPAPPYLFVVYLHLG